MPDIYKSVYDSSILVESFLRSGRILGQDETPQDMIERVVAALFKQELAFGTSHTKALSLINQFGSLLDSKAIAMSTPILTNAGKHHNRPLSACIVPTLDIVKNAREEIIKEVSALHEQGMGTGFDLDGSSDPVETLKFLNSIAWDGAQSGREDRPVGNMAVLSVYHPRISSFIDVKGAPSGRSIPWKFNISVNVDDDFFIALKNNATISLKDGTRVLAATIFDQLCKSAHRSADPGLVFLDRMNRRNAVPSLGLYRTTAPCGEVGLVNGEACQFGYINMAHFVQNDAQGRTHINSHALSHAVQLLTRFLDDALEISISNYNASLSAKVMAQKRKIGIGLCGVADAFSKVGMQYASEEARVLLKNVMALINCMSKHESICLAEERGACEAMKIDDGNRYTSGEMHLHSLYYEHSHAISSVNPTAWKQLDERIRTTRLLRNTSTTALPPTGRSAVVVDASQGIEPHFNLDEINPAIAKRMMAHIAKMTGQRLSLIDAYDAVHAPQSKGSTKLDREWLGGYIATARDITADNHLKMVVAAQLFTDESVSKTVNLPADASVDDVRTIYLAAWELGLSGVTMYVDGIFSVQPKKLRHSPTKKAERSDI